MDSKKGKVTIVLEDIVGPNLENGISANIKFEPVIITSKDLTRAQEWGVMFTEMILQASKKGVFVDPVNGETLEEIKGEEDGTDHDVH